MSEYKYLEDKDPWMLAEHFPDIDFFFCQIWLTSFVNDLEKSCGKNYKKVLIVFDPKFYIHFYYGEKDSLNFEKHLVESMKKNPKFGLLINKNIIKWSDKLREFSEKLDRTDLNKLSNKELWKLFEEQDQIHTNLYEWGWLSNASDMFHGSFTNEINDYLKSVLKKANRENEFNKISSILTTPREKSVAAIEEESLLKIALLIKNKETSIKVKKAIKDHHKKYFYLKNLWLGLNGVYDEDYFLKLAKSSAKDKVSPDKKIAKVNQELKEIKKKKKRLFKELGIDRKHQELLSVYSDFMLTKIYRRYSQIFWAYKMKAFLREAGKRLGLNLDEVRYMLLEEIKEGLLNSKINKTEIKKRMNFCIYYLEKGREFVSTNRNHFILTQLKSKKVKDVDELKGQVGCLGKVRGVVRIVNSQSDMNKMKEGDILVSISTNPDLVPAMKKAGGIVTEQGGVTCHAAIVSRELNTPCVIGTKIATKVLKDGDLVEVDANKGIVKIIK